MESKVKRWGETSAIGGYSGRNPQKVAAVVMGCLRTWAWQYMHVACSMGMEAYGCMDVGGLGWSRMLIHMHRCNN